MAQQAKIRITADEYYQLSEYQKREFIQLIDGEVVIPVAPRLKHQAIARELIILIGLIARETGGTAFDAPTEIYLDEANIYEPDILYLKPDTLCHLEDKRIVGAPELVVEVLSPSTAKYDKHQKYLAYEKHGVHEYWIVDPVHDLVEVWQLSNGAFQRIGAFAVGETFDSNPLGRTIAVSDIIPGDYQNKADEN